MAFLLGNMKGRMVEVSRIKSWILDSVVNAKFRISRCHFWFLKASFWRSIRLWFRMAKCRSWCKRFTIGLIRMEKRCILISSDHSRLRSRKLKFWSLMGLEVIRSSINLKKTRSTLKCSKQQWESSPKTK